MARGAYWGFSPWGRKELDVTEQLSTRVAAAAAAAKSL